MPSEKRRSLLDALTDADAEALLYDWAFWARPKQRMPSGDWSGWLLMEGRGTGKTRTGAESVREMVEAGHWGRVALVAPTAADARDVMVEGESGLLNICPPWNRPQYEPSKRRITWPNGAMATTYSADEPERLRGPQHDGAWVDEPGTWRYPATFDNLMLGLRIGPYPRWIATTTPRRTALIRKLLGWPGVVVTQESTYANRANLAPTFFEAIVAQYEGTTLGKQEIYGELLQDVDGSLWKSSMFDAEGFRLVEAPALKRVVVAIDPAITATAESNETGIIVAGLGLDGHGYVLADRTLRASPAGWAAQAVSAYDLHKADRIVVEANQGGDMVESTLRTIEPNLSVHQVHATRGKLTRAEPVAALYEKGVIHHVGMFTALEDQMTSWVPGEPSPDRMDALVWAFTDLMLGPSRQIEPVANPFYRD